MTWKSFDSSPCSFSFFYSRLRTQFDVPSTSASRSCIYPASIAPVGSPLSVIKVGRGIQAPVKLTHVTIKHLPLNLAGRRSWLQAQRFYSSSSCHRL